MVATDASKLGRLVAVLDAFVGGHGPQRWRHLADSLVLLGVPPSLNELEPDQRIPAIRRALESACASLPSRPGEDIAGAARAYLGVSDALLDASERARRIAAAKCLILDESSLRRTLAKPIDNRFVSRAEQLITLAAEAFAPELAADEAPRAPETHLIQSAAPRPSTVVSPRPPRRDRRRLFYAVVPLAVLALLAAGVGAAYFLSLHERVKTETVTNRVTVPSASGHGLALLGPRSVLVADVTNGDGAPWQGSLVAGNGARLEFEVIGRNPNANETLTGVHFNYSLSTSDGIGTEFHASLTGTGIRPIEFYVPITPPTDHPLTLLLDTIPVVLNYNRDGSKVATSLDSAHTSYGSIALPPLTADTVRSGFWLDLWAEVQVS